MTHPAEYPVSENLEAALTALQHAWVGLRAPAPCPFDNTAARFDSPVFCAHAYSWGDEDQPWNFKWRDVEVRWYKYLGRGMTVNRPVSDAEVRTMLAQCMQALLAAPQAPQA